MPFKNIRRDKRDYVPSTIYGYEDFPADPVSRNNLLFRRRTELVVKFRIKTFTASLKSCLSGFKMHLSIKQRCLNKQRDNKVAEKEGNVVTKHGASGCGVGTFFELNFREAFGHK